mgnify:CR=1 FL=1|jgi:hypothetical protein
MLTPSPRGRGHRGTSSVRRVFRLQRVIAGRTGAMSASLTASTTARRVFKEADRTDFDREGVSRPRLRPRGNPTHSSVIVPSNEAGPQTKSSSPLPMRSPRVSPPFSPAPRLIESLTRLTQHKNSTCLQHVSPVQDSSPDWPTSRSARPRCGRGFVERWGWHARGAGAG